MPAHHPIFEGKMVYRRTAMIRTGRQSKLLKEPTVNLVCIYGATRRSRARSFTSIRL